MLRASYAHLGFVETHRASEKGFHRVYLRLPLPDTGQEGATSLAQT
jgi:hypothetical protein